MAVMHEQAGVVVVGHRVQLCVAGSSEGAGSVVEGQVQDEYYIVITIVF